MARLTLPLSPIGYGAFKIGRNVGTKYNQAYELPDHATVEKLLNGVLDLGINYIDTAPAYCLIPNWADEMGLFGAMLITS